jgi:endonuclease-8
VPEGDTVYQTARSLDVLSGQVLTASDFRIPSLATSDLAGRTVLETISRGKHLLIRLEGEMTLHSHLKMEGAWDVQALGARWRRPEHEARAILRTEKTEAIGYAVLLDLVPTPGESSVVGHLGPDLLGPDWDLDAAVGRLRRLPHIPVGEALLDQRNLAGIGNIYRAEACFVAGFDPHRPVADVDNLPRLVAIAQRMLEIHKDRHSRVTTGDKRPGRRMWVYGRRGPFLRCGTRIRLADQGDGSRERPTYWCPVCQSGPAPAPAPRRVTRRS